MAKRQWSPCCGRDPQPAQRARPGILWLSWGRPFPSGEDQPCNPFSSLRLGAPRTPGGQPALVQVDATSHGAI
eukprot:scaffold179_cov368-Prasinococcus_capsulatus_cf.AAC.28